MNTEYDPIKDNLLGKFFLFVLGLSVIGGLIYAATNSNLSDLFASVKVATTPSAALTLDDGLILHYTFDAPDVDWSSTTAEVRDVSGNNNHGNASTTMSSKSVEVGKLGQALSFDGVDSTLDQYVTVNNSSAFSFGADTDFSVSFWIKNSDPSLGWYFFDFEGYSSLLTRNSGFNCYYDVSAGFRRVGCGITGVSGIQTWSGTQALSVANQWYFVTYTADRNGYARLYVNNVLQNSSDISSIGNISFENIKLIGCGESGGDQKISNACSTRNSLDDVRIYDRLLTEEEITQLYKIGEGTKIATTPALPANDSLNDGLVGHWTFDGPDIKWASTTTEIRDVSGNGRHLNASTTMSVKSAVLGILGQALYFNGTNQYAAVASPINRTEPNGFAIFGWARPEKTSSNGNVIFGKQYDNFVVTDWLEDGDYECVLGNEGGHFFITGSYIPPSHVWTHFGCSFSTSTKQLTMWVNGQALSTVDASTFTRLGNDDGHAFNVGFDNVTHQQYFKGAVDDVRAYNRSLSAEEVQRLYDMGEGTKIATTIKPPGSPLEQGLVGHWTFDGPDIKWASTSTEIRDVSDSGNHGNAINLTAQSATVGKLGQGMRFNGDSVISMGDPVNGTLDPTGSFSLSVWIKTTQSMTSGQYAAIAGKGYLNNDKGYGLFLNGDNSSKPAFQARTFASTAQTSSPSIPSINDGEWHHLVGVRDHSGSASKLYVDGILVDTAILALSDYTTGAEFGVGKSSYNLTFWRFPLTGSVDDVRFYNRALSDQEVEQLYQLAR
jgi:hypothetical protein